MKFQNQVLSLHSDALAADTLMVQKLSGREQMSGLFRFDLDLICSDPELDLEAVLYAPARLGIKVQVKIAGGQVGMSTREIAGVFEEFEQLEEGQGWTKYRAVLVPKLWNTTRSFRSRIFQEMTIEDVVQAVLEKDGLDPQLDFEFQLQRHGDEDPETRPIYPKREYVVQYEESDWNFLARWLEHEGIYFFFSNEDGEEKVVFADTESAYADSPFGSSYPYRPEAKGEGTDSDKFTEEEIRSFRCRQTRLPTQVAVNDYNWRVPSARLHFTEDVREAGTGLQTEYNDHFKDEAQGKAIAKVRREELECRAKVFYGTGSCRAFRPGTTFALEEHFRDDFNRSYLLVSVEHEAEQMISLESSTITGVKYENTFTAISDDQPWRPERRTEWPSIKGVMHAKVDAEGDGTFAELDEHGRYKLKMPFDEHSDEADDGKASRWVRMAQPYAGVNAGMHFPLLKGTEVLVTHIDGDPDRPIISGAVPNPETESPATNATLTRNAMTTASGNTMQIDDAPEARGFLMADASGSIVDDRRRHMPRGSAAANASSPGGGNGAVRPAADGVAPTPAAHDERPGSGAGMARGDEDFENKVSQWDGDARSAWHTFMSGDALRDIKTRGCYQTDSAPGDGSDANSLSTADWSSQGGVQGPTDDNNALNHAGFKEILKNLSTVAVNLGYEGFSRGGDQRVGLAEFFRQVHNFTGEAYGSRLRTWVGDDWMIKWGDKYTYNDVTNDVSIGTGGFGWKEEHGDTDDHSWHWGTAKSYSHHTGDDVSRSYRKGRWASDSYTYGAFAAFNLQFDAHATFSLTGSIHTENSIDLGVYNSNSVFVGVKGGIEVTLAALIDTQIGLTRTFLEVGSDSRLKMTREDGVWLTKSEAGLKDFKATLSKTDAALKSEVAALKRDIAALSKTDAAVKQTDAAVSQSAAAVKDDKAAVNAQLAAIMRNSLSASSSSQSASSTELNAFKSM
ncbi:MAG: type VI secretion system Vgr family protein [Planctomycetota bacterium]